MNTRKEKLYFDRRPFKPHYQITISPFLSPHNFFQSYGAETDEAYDFSSFVFKKTRMSNHM